MKALPRQQIEGLSSCSPPFSFRTLAKKSMARCAAQYPTKASLLAGFQIVEMAFTGISDIWPGNFFAGINIHCILRRGINRRTG
jgi:hypothetical protein